MTSLPAHRRFARLLAAVCALAFFPAAHGATIYKLLIHRQDGRYEAHAAAHLDARPQRVFAVLKDFSDLKMVSDGILESRILHRDDAGISIIYTVMRGCALIFCYSIKQQQRATTNGSDTVKLVTVPGHGNVREGFTIWHVSPEGKGTLLRWDSSLKPDFWIPPLVGPAVVRRALRHAGKAFVRGVERRAKNGLPVTARNR